MFKLVVLSALVAVVVAKPHLVHQPAAVAYSVPAATSYTYREDTVSKPAVISTYAHVAPVVEQVVAAPVVAKTVAVAPAAVSHTYREDVISQPAVVSTYSHAAPVVKSVAYAAPAVAYSAPVVGYSSNVAAPWVAENVAPVAYSAHGVHAW